MGFLILLVMKLKSIYLLKKYFNDFFKPLDKSDIRSRNSLVLYGASGNKKTNIVLALVKEIKIVFILLSINDLLTTPEDLTDNIDYMFAFLDSSPRAILMLDEIDLLLKNK